MPKKSNKKTANNLQTIDEDGYTALHLAILNRNWPMTVELVENEANVDAQNPHNLNALSLAISQRDYHVMSLLIDNYVNLEAENDSGQTALHISVELQDLIAMNLLLRNDANVRATDINDNTPLHIAATIPNYFSFMAARSLIINGAEVNAFNSYGQRALDLANLHGNSNTAELLLYHNGLQSIPETSNATPHHDFTSYFDTPVEQAFSFLGDIKE
jgi:ankyrin repeat protein